MATYLKEIGGEMKFRDNFPELGPNQWTMLLRLLMEVAPENRDGPDNCDCTFLCDCQEHNETVEAYKNNIKALLEENK